MLPGFETVLLDHVAGEIIEQTIAATDAFGMPNPQNQHCFPVDKFRELIEDEFVSTEVGSVVAFSDPGGIELPGVITAISDSSISVDFNHPLAGRDIVFKAQILSVLDPEQQALEINL